jgi:hypothetical protein
LSNCSKQNGSYIVETNECVTSESQCIEKEEYGYIWNNDKCIYQEAFNCIKEGFAWIQSQCIQDQTQCANLGENYNWLEAYNQCVSKREYDCVENNKGVLINNKTCLVSQEDCQKYPELAYYESKKSQCLSLTNKNICENTLKEYDFIWDSEKNICVKQ